MNSRPDRTPLTRQNVRTRSPGYPQISLQEAIAKAQKVRESLGHRSGTQHDVLGCLGYPEESSQGRGTLAALRRFGLIDRSGKRGHYRFKISSQGEEILTLPHDSQQYREVIKKAALNPNIHRSVWQKFGGSLPDDSRLREYLTYELGFNRNQVHFFVLQLRDTIEFAGLEAGEKLDYEPAAVPLKGEEAPATRPEESPPISSLPPQKEGGSPEAHSSEPLSADKKNAPNIETRELPIPLENGRTMRVPYPMSEEDFEIAMQTLQLWKSRIVRKPH